MARGITIQDLQKSACAAKNPHLFTDKKQRQPRKVSKHVLWIGEQLKEWCEEKGYELKEEYRFHQARKFRFDFFIVELRLGIEYNGLVSDKSRHTTLKGYTGDMEKINLAQSEGYKVVQFTILNYLKVIDTIEKIL